MTRDSCLVSALRRQITKPTKERFGRFSLAAADEELQRLKHGKAEVTICLQRKRRAGQRDDTKSACIERSANPRKFFKQRAIQLAGLVDLRAKCIENVFGYKV